MKIPVTAGSTDVDVLTIAAGQVLAPHRRRTSKTPYLLISGSVLVLLLGLGYPVYWQITTSLQQYGLAQQFGKPPTFVGLQNYIRIFGTPDLWTVVFRSVVFCLVNAFVTVGIGLAFALLMRSVHSAIRIALQVVLLLAWAMPMVATVIVFRWLFDYRTGVVNWMLVRIGVSGARGFSWLSQPLTFFFVATVIIVWMSVPFVALSVFAGLTQVPDEVLEAARIDGAGPAQIVRRILVPMIRPVLSIVLLLQIIWDLRVFAQIKLLQDGGAPVTQTNLLGTFIYQLGLNKLDFAGAAAVSIFVLILTAVLAAPYVRSMIKDELV